MCVWWGVVWAWDPPIGRALQVCRSASGADAAGALQAFLGHQSVVHDALRSAGYSRVVDAAMQEVPLKDVVPSRPDRPVSYDGQLTSLRVTY